MDTFENVFENPNIGLIFIIPRHRDTLRASGKGTVLAQDFAVNGRPAELVLLPRVERVMCHCPKAFVRGKVWQPDARPDTSDVPTLAHILLPLGAMTEAIEEVEPGIREDRGTGLY